MVRRFYNNEDDENESYFSEEDLEHPDEIAVDQDGLLEVMQMDLAHSELNQSLLGKAIGLAEKDFFWRFRSTKYKMAEVEAIYKQLLSITEQEEERPDGS